MTMMFGYLEEKCRDRHERLVLVSHEVMIDVPSGTIDYFRGKNDELSIV